MQGSGVFYVMATAAVWMGCTESGNGPTDVSSDTMADTAADTVHSDTASDTASDTTGDTSGGEVVVFGEYRLRSVPFQDQTPGAILAIADTNLSLQPNGTLTLMGRVRNDGNRAYCFVSLDDIVLHTASSTVEVDMTYVQSEVMHIAEYETDTCIAPGGVGLFVADIEEGDLPTLFDTATGIDLTIDFMDTAVEASTAHLELDGALEVVTEDTRIYFRGRLRNTGTASALTTVITVRVLVLTSGGLIVDDIFDSDIEQGETIAPGATRDFTTRRLPLTAALAATSVVILAWDIAD